MTAQQSAYTKTLKTAKDLKGIGFINNKYFHLRPTAKYSTIVCTWPKPGLGMRGIKRSSPKFIKEHWTTLENFDFSRGDQEIERDLLQFGFSKQEKKREKEYLIQSYFINYIQENTNALTFLGEKYANAKFIASEFVYKVDANQPKKLIIDVILECDGCILVLEIKKGNQPNPGDDPAQLQSYLDFYGTLHRTNTLELLTHYPNHSLTKPKPIEGAYLINSKPEQKIIDAAHPVIYYELTMDHFILLNNG